MVRIDGSTSKAYLKNLKRDFEKRVYVLPGHRMEAMTLQNASGADFEKRVYVRIIILLGIIILIIIWATVVIHTKTYRESKLILQTPQRVSEFETNHSALRKISGI